jgi:hypothetical protein
MGGEKTQGYLPGATKKQWTSSYKQDTNHGNQWRVEKAFLDLSRLINSTPMLFNINKINICFYIYIYIYIYYKSSLDLIENF